MEMVQACASVQKMEICHIRVPSSPRFAYRLYKHEPDPGDPGFLASPPSHYYVVPVFTINGR